MTETPSFLADRPEGPDLLSEMLGAVRLNGSAFLDGRFTAPFAVVSPARWDGNAQFARLKHVSVFHLIITGGAELETADGTQVTLRAGDVILMPFAAEHRFWSGDHADFVKAETLVRPGPIRGVDVVLHGGTGEESRFICGFVESSELMAAPLFRSLPHLLIERTSEHPVTSMVADTTARIIATMDEGGRPGAELMLGRLMELLFLEVLRLHAERLPNNSQGVLAAMGDEVVSRALGLMHAEPAKRWTIEALAQAAGASRTVLGERFTNVLGKPPIDYLAGWRIQLAADRLRAGRDPLAKISVDVGYESEAAFGRAFKRIMGVSPGAWRQAAV